MRMIPHLRFAGHYKHSETFPSTYVFPERTVSYYELEYYISAKESTIELDGALISVPENGIIFRRPGQVNRSHMPYESIVLLFSFDPLPDCDRLFFNFNEKQPLQPAYRHPLISGIPSLNMAGEDCLLRFQAIYEALVRSNPLGETVFTMHILALLYDLQKEQALPLIQGDNRAKPSSHPLLLKALEHIDRHLYEPIRLEDLCQELYISKRYLHILFKKHMNISPNVYITHQKMHIAKNMLRTSNLPITAISKQCGYESPTYFSAVFKKHTGQSPLRFRQAFEAG